MSDSPEAVSVNPEPGLAIRFTVRTDVSVGKRLLDAPAPSAKDEELRAQWQKVQLKDKGGGDKVANPRGGKGGKGAQMSLRPTRFVEACGPTEFPGKGDVVDCNFSEHNMLAAAVRTAFYEHYPLRLSPDVIWLTVVQGLAQHVQQDPEKHRSSFDIEFEGKKKLIVDRSGFVKGSPMNDWTTVFPEFCAQIGAHIGEKLLATLSCDFSTTDAVTKICSEIAIMDCVQSYFEYLMRCGCGIPSIELAGTYEDWLSLRGKAEVLLARFEGLEVWRQELLFLLDQFCAAAKGKPELEFWNSVCNLHGASGRWVGFMTGWLQILFPYLSDGQVNEGLGQWRKNYEAARGRSAAGGELDEIGKLNAKTEEAQGWSDFGRSKPPAGYAVNWEDLPTSISQAPVRYSDVGTNKEYEMSFNAGIVAVVQHPETLALEPVVSWAVLDHGEVGKPMSARAMQALSSCFGGSVP